MNDTRLCVVISGPSFDDAFKQIKEASSRCDILEFRLDLFDFKEHSKIKVLKEFSPIPVIFTFRKASQGGHCFLPEDLRLKKLKDLAELQPDYIDLEFDTTKEFFHEIHSLFPAICLICSWHHFTETPLDLNALLNQIWHPEVSIYKIASMANSTIDALRMLNFVKQQSKIGRKLIGLCMGELGQITRILAPLVRSHMTYSILDDCQEVAPGQLGIDTLLQTYHYPFLSPKTAIFGLIGDPVCFSKGHITHNQEYRKRNSDAVYVKMKIAKEELEHFFDEAHQLGIKGLSVTMPLKEAVQPYTINQSQIDSVNTLTFTDHGVHGINTDGIAVQMLLQQRVSLKNKIVVLLGAGGTAKAVAYHLYLSGASLIILNRTLAKAQHLASQYQAKSGTLSDFCTFADHGYDILINCTSVGFAEEHCCPITVDHLLSNRTVVDVISFPRETFLIKEAKKKECLTICGDEIFHLQASKQLECWGLNESL